MINKEKLSNISGQIKYSGDRVKQYIIWVQTYLILILYYDNHPFKYWHFVFIPIVIFLWWFDRYFVLPGEVSYVHKNSKILEKINEKLDKIIEK